MEQNTKERLPPAIETLLANLKDKQQPHWLRQNYKNRVVDFRTLLDAAIREFDTEGASKENQLKKNIKRGSK